MVSTNRMRDAIRRAEEARETAQFGVSRSALARSRALIASRPDPAGDAAAQEAVKVYERVYDEAVANGATEDAAYQEGIKAGVDRYLGTPPGGAHEVALDAALETYKSRLP